MCKVLQEERVGKYVLNPFTNKSSPRGLPFDLRSKHKLKIHDTLCETKCLVETTIMLYSNRIYF